MSTTGSLRAPHSFLKAGNLRMPVLLLAEDPALVQQGVDLGLAAAEIGE